ncbi:DinB family protein [Paenibacillus illinoisensis]|uniref:DinB family protein n=1 Tax=Paenibacillus illinoisensis TaxID=59845 RepID=UPI00301AFC6D
MEIFENQYWMIQQTRELLFRYCEEITQEDYVREVELLGGASIRNLHVHVADCYRVWLGVCALQQSIAQVKPQSIENVGDMRQLFKRTDDLMQQFLRDFRNEWNPEVRESWHSDSVELTELWLFTHSITHEFHHQGQILKIGRHLGYIPPKMNLAKR